MLYLDQDSASLHPRDINRNYGVNKMTVIYL